MCLSAYASIRLPEVNYTTKLSDLYGRSLAVRLTIAGREANPNLDGIDSLMKNVYQWVVTGVLTPLRRARLSKVYEIVRQSDELVRAVKDHMRTVEAKLVHSLNLIRWEIDGSDTLRALVGTLPIERVGGRLLFWPECLIAFDRLSFPSCMFSFAITISYYVSAKPSDLTRAS